MSIPHDTSNNSDSFNHGASDSLSAAHGREEYAAGGLSTAHIGTLSNVTLWDGGRLMRVQRNSTAQPQKGGGKRGSIDEFSYSSRRRLLRMLAQLAVEDLPIFVTLTFPDEFYPWHDKPVQWKKILKAFKLRFTRRFPDAAFVWRLEMVTRKSGKYVGVVFPHYHLLVWGVSLGDLMGWVFINWWEVCSKLSDEHLKAGTRVEKVRSARGVLFYAGKYVAKQEKYSIPCGRVWGVHNSDCLPWVKAICVQLSEREAVKLMRYARRFAHLRGRDYKSLTIFCDAGFWYKRLVDIIYPEQRKLIKPAAPV